MFFIDWILNVAGLLLWLSWRSWRFDPLVRTSAASLAGTLRRAEPRSGRGWNYLLGLALLLLLRAAVYWILGAPVEWTPKLHLGFVVLAFRADHFGPMLLYSVVGFARLLMISYLWLLVIALINRRVLEPDPVLRLIRLHLGRALRWPWPAMVCAVPVIVAILWGAAHPLLVWTGVLPSEHSAWHFVQQSLMLTLALVLSLKLLFPVFLLLHFISMYVYLGSSPFWDFIAMTASRVMLVVRWLPLRFGKLDARPLAAVAVILVALHWLPQLLEARMAQRGVVLWPQ